MNQTKRNNTNALLELMNYFALEYKYEENEYTKEYVIQILYRFGETIFIIRWYDFQNPWNSHDSEQFQIHNESKKTKINVIDIY